jgi:hypothetical protein
MTDRAGSYIVETYRGVIRRDRGPLYRCTHVTHPTRAAARQCAREALAYLNANPEAPLPVGWTGCSDPEARP